MDVLATTTDVAKVVAGVERTVVGCIEIMVVGWMEVMICVTVGGS